METEYYTFEQLVSAGIACYSTMLLKEDIDKFTIGLKVDYPKLIRIDSAIRYTSSIISYDKLYYHLYQRLNLDDYIYYGHQKITIQEYLMFIAGATLIDYMIKDELNYGNPRLLKRK